MGNGGEWQVDKAWADDHFGETERVIRRAAGHMVRVAPSSVQRDREEAIDYDVDIPSGRVACRIRRDETCRGRRDLTITVKRPSGVPTEYEKLLKGNVAWYLYAWARDGKFVEWMFVDLSVVRKKHLLQEAVSRKDTRSLSDGSQFVFVSFETLYRANAVVDHTVRTVRSVATAS